MEPNELQQSGICKSVIKHENDVPEEALYRGIDVEELVKRYLPENYKRYTPKPNFQAILGAIYGDIAGSRYEFSRYTKIESPDCSHNYSFTDDTIMSLATAKTILETKKIRWKNKINKRTLLAHKTVYGKTVEEFEKNYKEFGRKYPNPEGGYGAAFYQWLNLNMSAYGSRGNGSAMRVSPVGSCGMSAEDTIRMAILSAVCTHDNIEGVKGACVEAMCIWLACAGASKEEIFMYMKDKYTKDGVCLFNDFTSKEASMMQLWQEQCPFSVPAAIIAVNESDSFDDAIEKGISVGMDSDTNACIAGAVAGPLYNEDNYTIVKQYLDSDLLEVLYQWRDFVSKKDHIL